MLMSLDIYDFLRKGRGVFVFLLSYFAVAVVFLFLAGLQYPISDYCIEVTAEIDYRDYSFILLSANFAVVVLSRLLLAGLLRSREACPVYVVLIWIVAEMAVSVAAGWGIALALFPGVSFFPKQLLFQMTVDVVKLYAIPMAMVTMVMLVVKYRQKYRQEMMASKQKEETAPNVDNEQATRLSAEEPTPHLPEFTKQAHLTAEEIFSEMIGFYDRTNDFDFSLPLKDVLYVETSDNYVSVNYLDEGHSSSRIIRNTMKNMEEYLRPYGFFRCHRQYLVNAYNIKLVSKGKEGLLIRLRGSSTVIPVSKTYAAGILPVHMAAPDNPSED